MTKDLKNMILANCNIDEQEDIFDVLFRDMLGTSYSRIFSPIEKIQTPIHYPVDMYTDNDGIHIDIVAIDAKKEDINIEIKNADILSVSYNKSEKSKTENDNESTKKYFMKNITKKSFQFDWRLASKFNIDKIDVKLIDGVLKIFVPYKENHVEKKQITIQ